MIRAGWMGFLIVFMLPFAALADDAVLKKRAEKILADTKEAIKRLNQAIGERESYMKKLDRARVNTRLERSIIPEERERGRITFNSKEEKEKYLGREKLRIADLKKKIAELKNPGIYFVLSLQYPPKKGDIGLLYNATQNDQTAVQLAIGKPNHQYNRPQPMGGIGNGNSLYKYFYEEPVRKIIKGSIVDRAVTQMETKEGYFVLKSKLNEKLGIRGRKYFYVVTGKETFRTRADVPVEYPIVERIEQQPILDYLNQMKK